MIEDISKRISKDALEKNRKYARDNVKRYVGKNIISFLGKILKYILECMKIY